MGVSLDGYIAGPGGDITWGVPGEELHRFHNEQARELGVHLCGRGLYETMVYWETVDETGLPPVEREFAGIWRDLPKIVFSRTLEQVEGNATLATGEVASEVGALKAEAGAEVAVGGAGLASSLIELDLIDEYRPFVYPVVLGGGTPFFPPLERRLDLELVETRRFETPLFGPGVVYMRYRRA
jgi:dihydrofolate reductase